MFNVLWWLSMIAFFAGILIFTIDAVAETIGERSPRRIPRGLVVSAAALVFLFAMTLGVEVGTYRQSKFYFEEMGVKQSLPRTTLI